MRLYAMAMYLNKAGIRWVLSLNHTIMQYCIKQNDIILSILGYTHI